MQTNAISILGSIWDIRFASGATDATFASDPTCGGYTDTSCNTIVLRDTSEYELSPCHVADISDTAMHMLRHELIHAFLYECGLADNSDWASNEEMIDWLAIQFDKLTDLFQNAEWLMNQESKGSQEAKDSE